MKTDTYKNICLQQASLSPLKYRHGCIVVKGGKIIGQGFNDYRPGYDGGSLKTGQLSAASFPRVASLEKPKKHTNSFKPFEQVEGIGGGHLANTPLTMHSEMMAINSALSSSNTNDYYGRERSPPLSSALASPSSSKEFNKAPLVFMDKSGVLKPLQGEPAGQHHESKKKNRHHHGQHQGQHHHHGHYDYEYKYHTCGNNKPQQPRSQQQHKSQRASSNETSDNNNSDISTAPKPRIHRAAKSSTLKLKNHFGGLESPDNQLLLPKARAKGHNILHRMKHPKLVGADLYVTRLCNVNPTKEFTYCRNSNPPDTLVSATEKSRHVLPEEACCSPSLSRSTTSTGSLHDELIYKEPTPVVPAPASPLAIPTEKAGESRPCYRCVAYMDSVGIKRVFWTNNEGDWESAKVRDLVDQLETCGTSGDDDGLGLFVTKHEVLKLRRVFGQI